MDLKDIPSRQHGEKLVECDICGRRYVGAELIGRRCPHCGESLSEAAPLDEQPVPDVPSVEVYRAPDHLEADLIHEYLDEHGIRVAFQSDFPSAVFPFSIEGLDQVRILALATEADEARRLIEEFHDEGGPERMLQSDASEDEEETEGTPS
jgi:hypothetical protein